MSEELYEGMLSKERIRFFSFTGLAVAAPFLFSLYLGDLRTLILAFGFLVVVQQW